MEYNNGKKNAKAVLWLADNAPEYVLDYLTRRNESLEKAIEIVKNVSQEFSCTTEDLIKAEEGYLDEV